MSTEKQRGFIAELIIRNELDNKVFEEIVKTTPTHNEKYTDQRVNYQYQILADRLSKMTFNQADYFIKSYTGVKNYHRLKARNIILSLNLIKI